MASHSDTTGIIDTDSRFVIDIVTGKIENHSDKESLRQYSHNSERFSFEMPRHVDGHDMTNCTKVTVNYLAADIPGEYEVDDLAVDSEADDKITFSWLISSNVTQKKGKLRFAVVFECAKEDGTITYRWPTDINYDYEIKETISNDSGIVYENVDILEQWKQQLFYGSNSVTANIQAEGRRQQALVANKGSEVKKSIPDDYATLSDRVSELCDHMDLNIVSYTFSWIGSKKVNTTDGKLFDPGIYAASSLKPCYSNFVTIGDGIDHLEIHRSVNDNKVTGGAFYSAASESYFISGFKEDSGNNISVPDGAKYFRINSTTDGSSNLALVVNGIPKETAVEVLKKSVEDIKADAEETNEEIRGLKEDVDEYDSKLRSLVEVDATEVIANKLIKLKSKEEYDLMGSCYIKQNIPSSVRKIKVSGRSASAEYGYSLGAFYKADGTFISAFGNDNDTFYTDLKVDVPDGTAFIYVNQSQIASEKYEKVKFFVVFDVINNMEQSLQDIIELKSNLHNKANSPKDKKEIELDSFTQGGLIKVDGTILPFNGYEYGYTSAQLGDEFYVTGNAWKGTLPVFAEFDANNNVVRSFTGDDSLPMHEESSYKEQYFRVQNEKTTRVGFNGSTSGEFKLSVKKNTLLSVEEYVNKKTSKIYTDVDKLSVIKYGDCVKKPYTFNAKRCDVFGDSIARGWVHWDTTKYPITENNWVKLFCDKVGMTFSNHAVGGSTSKGVLSQITGVGELTSDYVFVAFGVNDWQDAIALNDFRNNVNAICNALKENFTGIDVIFITPINHAG